MTQSPANMFIQMRSSMNSLLTNRGKFHNNPKPVRLVIAF